MRWRWWRKKSIPRIKIINYLIRNNKTYEILFKGQQLFLNKKNIWTRTKEKIPSDVTCILKLIGTSPRSFGKRAKRKTRTSEGSN